jgi:serine/threonine protein kinase
LKGKGSFGEVYTAYDPDEKAKVALKFIEIDKNDGKDVLKEFEL